MNPLQHAQTEPPPVCIIVSRYNGSITGAMLAGAEAEYARRGGDPANLGVIEAPGTFELPVLAATAAEAELYEGVVAIGCVIRGETDHDRYISTAVATELARIATDSTIPVAFGVLTCNTIDQAVARAGGPEGSTGHGNKGAEAMAAVLDTIAAQAMIAQASVDHTPGIRTTITGSPADKAETA